MPIAYNERTLPLAQGSSAFSSSMRLAYDFTGVGSLPLWAAYDYVGATAPTATQFQTTTLVTYNGIPGRRYANAGPVAQYDSTTDYGFKVGTGDLTTCILFSTPSALPTTSGYVDFVNFGNEVGNDGFTFRVFHDASLGWIINPIGVLGGTVTGQGRTYIGADKTVAVFIRRASGVVSTWRVIIGDDASAQRINSDYTASVDYNNMRRLRFYDGGTNGADAPALHSFRFHGAALTNEQMLSYASDYWAVDQYVSDTTAPTFTGSITVGAKTSSTIALVLPTATDDTAVTGYQYRVNGGAWQATGTSVSLTGLAALTSYTIDARAYDAIPNYSGTLSVTTSTYRAGASAGSIVTATAPQDGNPAGFLYALAGTLPVSDWVSYTITSGPTPAGGTLDAQTNGAFSYTGPSPATMVVQPEVNGVAYGEPITVTLYDQAGGGGEPEPAPDTAAPTWTGPITLLSRTTTTATLQLPTATDASGSVSYQYSLNGGAWQSTGATVNLSGLAEATSYTLDARALDAVPNYSGTLSITFSTRSGVVSGPPTERWDGTQWVVGGVFRRGNGAGGFVTGGRPRRWNGTDWT